MSAIPKDPNMLYSFINMKLRDSDASFEEFCAANDVDPVKILETLSAAGFIYYESVNQFK